MRSSDRPGRFNHNALNPGNIKNDNHVSRTKRYVTKNVYNYVSGREMRYVTMKRKNVTYLQFHGITSSKNSIRIESLTFARCAVDLYRDIADPAPTVSYLDSVVPGGNGVVRVITRTWRATDASGNSVQADQTITVLDATAPVIELNGR